MENPRLLYNNTKIIWFQFCSNLHRCSSILLQKEYIDCAETITGFRSSLFTEKKIFFLSKMSTLRIEEKTIILPTDRLLFFTFFFYAALPVDQYIKLILPNWNPEKKWLSRKLLTLIITIIIVIVNLLTVDKKKGFHII